MPRLSTLVREGAKASDRTTDPSPIHIIERKHEMLTVCEHSKPWTMKDGARNGSRPPTPTLPFSQHWQFCSLNKEEHGRTGSQGTQRAAKVTLAS